MMVAVLAAGLVAAGVGTLPLLRAEMWRNLENAAVQNAQSDRVTERMFEITQGAGAPRIQTRSPAPRTDYFVAIYDASGELVATAGGESSDAPQPILPESIPSDRAYLAKGRTETLDADHGPGFVSSVSDITVSTGGGYSRSYTQLVAMPLDEVEDFLRSFFVIFTLVSLATVIIGALLTRLLVTLTFRRFGQVEVTAMEIASGDFSQRMTDIEPSTEIGRLKIAINTMLDRIDGAIEERDSTVKQMRRFIGDASHELRTPLVSVRGYAELYRMGAIQGDEATAKAMERIENEAKRMGVLVEDLLALARLDDKRELDIRPVDLRPIAHDAALDVRVAEPGRQIGVTDHTFEALTAPVVVISRAAARAGAEPSDQPRKRWGAGSSALAAATRSVLRRRRSESGELQEVELLDMSPPAPSKSVALPPIVLGEEDKIRQVVANLLGNARRYSPEGTPIELEVGVDADRGRGWIAVVDHGEGIPESIREKVFQRFWRADTSRARETGGSGLGLSIVASIVDSLAGEVSVLETPGGGATFRVSFPLVPDAFGDDSAWAATTRAHPGTGDAEGREAVENSADGS